MSWSEFEALIGEAFRRRSYTVEETGGNAPDGGVEDAPEGGYTARAVGESIFTEAETLDDLHNRV